MQVYKELSSYLTPIYFSLQLPQLFLIMFPFHFFLNYPAETSLSSVSVATCARLWGHTLDMGNLTVATPSVKDGFPAQQLSIAKRSWVQRRNGEHLLLLSEILVGLTSVCNQSCSEQMTIATRSFQKTAFHSVSPYPLAFVFF